MCSPKTKSHISHTFSDDDNEESVDEKYDRLLMSWNVKYKKLLEAIPAY